MLVYSNHPTHYINQYSVETDKIGNLNCIICGKNNPELCQPTAHDGHQTHPRRINLFSLEKYRSIHIYLFEISLFYIIILDLVPMLWLFTARYLVYS